MALPGYFGWSATCEGEVLARLFNLKKVELGAHHSKLHREIVGLQGNLEDLTQVLDRLILPYREDRDLLFGIIGRSKERKTLDVVPMKVSESDGDLVLDVTDGTKILAELSQTRACIHNGDAVGISERDLKTGGVAPELLKSYITNGNRTARAVEFELHDRLYES